MEEDAQKIFDYLPINKSSFEEDYINHLWSSFLSLLNSESEEAKPFCIMPFHLLFMLSIQYKVLRIAKVKNHSYNLIYTIKSLRDDQKDLIVPNSPFVIALLRESEIIDIFKLIKLDQNILQSIKFLIRNRNDKLAHAKGGIDLDYQTKINKYLDLLQLIQNSTLSLNEKVALRWLKESKLKKERSEFIKIHLAEEYLCMVDFENGKLVQFNEYL
ncbi:MAG: hypothetical protein WC744_04470 [Patescibacteria group bacterium]|jgi:hypothetical protein